MANANALFDYIRDLTATGINGANWQVIRLADDEVIASGTTALDGGPNTDLAGMLAVDEVTLGYPGPIKYRVTDLATGITREHTSKSIGIVGPFRMLDFAAAFGMMLDGVVDGLRGELAVTGTGTTPAQVGVAGGAAFGHGMIYQWPVGQTLDVGAGGAQGRIDIVVLRYYLPGHVQEGRVDLAVTAGIPAASPVEPSVVQDDVTAMIWEVKLAAIQVDPGVNMIAPSKVFDRRAYTIGPRLDTRYLRKDVFDHQEGGLEVDGTFIVRTPSDTYRLYFDVTAPSFQLRNATDFNIYKGNGTNLSFGIDGLSGQLRVADDKPSVNVHAALGTGATGTVEWGNDLMCEINLKAGSSPGVGDLCTVVFKRDRLGTKYGVWLQPQDANAAETDAYISGRSVDGFHIYSRGPLKPGQNHSYMVIMGGLQ
jgi:hypothetical protein